MCPSAASMQQMLELDLNNELDESLSHELRFALLNLRKTLISKCIDVEEPSALPATLEGFEESLRLCAGWQLRCESDHDELLVRRFRELATLEDLGLSFIDWSLMFQYGKMGSGRSAGTEARDFYKKFFDSQLTTTHEFLIPLYKRYISHFPEWESAEKSRSAVHGEVKIVANCGLSTVAKKRTRRRVTVKQASLDMFFQLGLGALITERLRMLGITLKDQPFRNKALAKQGSIDGLTATIDLREASDRISTKMAMEFFPRLGGLFQTVSSYHAKSAYSRKVYNLTMLGSMGNGATFPFQTLVFATVVRAVARVQGFKLVYNDLKRKFKGPGNWGVFGDDIVVPTALYGDVCRLCNLLGFEVNADKSYATGSFRESCGGDFLNGIDVRGLYVKSLKQPQDRYNAANRLLLWSAIYGVNFPYTLSHLLDGLPDRYVPIWADVTSGLRMPYAFTRMKPAFKSWRPLVKREALPMEGDGGNYIAFLGGYLRTDPIPFEDGQPSRRSGITCLQQGYIGVPREEDDVQDEDVECQYVLRWSNCPEQLWDSWAPVGQSVVSSAVVKRFESRALNVATRRHWAIPV